jgi:hypothetical protein
MLDADENKPVGKSGQRNRKAEQQSGKTGQRSRKSAQKQSSKPDQLLDAHEQVGTPIASSARTDADQVDSIASSEQMEDAQELVSAPTITSSESCSTESTYANAEEVDSVTPSAETVPVSFQSLAKAYEDYARKSFEQTRFLFEKLASVRSLDKALELQTDFVRHACDMFISDSQKICGLHRGLAKQRLASLEGFVAKMAPSR